MEPNAITDISTTGMSREMAVKMLSRVGEQFGVGHKSGTYDKADPTKFTKWKLPIYMEVGLGDPIKDDDGNQVFPPDPEIVVVTFHDVTWGIDIGITSTFFRISGYWDQEVGQNPQSNPKHWHRVVADKFTPDDSDVKRVQIVDTEEKLNSKIHEVIVRLLTEGEWGVDKLPNTEEDPMGGIET